MRLAIEAGAAVRGSVGEGRMADIVGEAEGVKGQKERLIWRRWRKAECRDHFCWFERRRAAAWSEFWREEMADRVVVGVFVCRPDGVVV